MSDRVGRPTPQARRTPLTFLFPVEINSLQHPQLRRQFGDALLLGFHFVLES